MNPQEPFFQICTRYHAEIFRINNLAKFYQILRGSISKLASLDTMITVFFTLFSSLFRAIFGYFGNHFGVCFSFFENRLILSHEILYSYYSDDHYTKNNFSCHVFLCWEPFWHIFGPTMVCGLLFFGNHSMFFHEIFHRFLKTLWPLFMDWVQLSRGYRATSRRQLIFYHKSPEGAVLSITLMVSQLRNKRNIFSVNHPPTSSPSARNHFQVFLDLCFVCMFLYVLRNSIFSDDIYLHRTLGNSLQPLRKNNFGSFSAWIFWCILGPF